MVIQNLDTKVFNNSIHFLFICVLTQQPRGQLQSEYEWNKERKEHKSQNKTIYNIWVMLIIK
jgi:hypothetical protein